MGHCCLVKSVPLSYTAAAWVRVCTLACWDNVAWVSAPLSFVVGWDTVAWVRVSPLAGLLGGTLYPGIECPPLPRVNSDCVHRDKI